MVGERAKFSKGKQREFLMKVIGKLMCRSLRDLLQFGIDVPYSTLKNYFIEEHLIPLSLLKDICHLSKIDINSLNIIILPENWGAIKGGKRGIISMMKIYEDKLPLWRARGNKKIAEINTKKINFPKLNEELAEFIGIYLGDGTLTKYFLRISGDYRYDLPYFNYIYNLVFRLFGIKPKIIKDKRPINTCYLLIGSKKICSLLNKTYGLKFGDKIRNKNHIPKKILMDDKLSIACLRGLVDTDGSVSRRGRNGSQFCVQFTNHNPLLLKQVYMIGKKFNIFTYFTGNEVGTNKWENILKYFEKIGSSNLRHIVRFYSRYKDNRTLYLREVPIYYEKSLYKSLNLPFKMGSWSNG